jgi:hypothetical protein
MSLGSVRIDADSVKGLVDIKKFTVKQRGSGAAKLGTLCRGKQRVVNASKSDWFKNKWIQKRKTFRESSEAEQRTKETKEISFQLGVSRYVACKNNIFKNRPCKKGIFRRGIIGILLHNLTQHTLSST